MMKPIVNMNGTSREHLLSHRLDVLIKLKESLELMLELQPHGRDYPGAEDQYLSDRARHAERLDVIKSLQHEIEAEALYMLEFQ